MPNPVPGEVLGSYRIEGQLGAGSMGEVFRAIDTGLNRRVAIKLLSDKHRDSIELRRRFEREGRAVAAVSHPNVVQVFATGSFDDRPYIAMELLDGTDLGSTVERGGPLASAAAAHVVLDAAQGLAAAAKAGLIHRDVKPSNLVRMSDGRVKVTDFGLAKPVDPGSEPALTAMGVVVGTPDYIAPEQARGEPIDERVDIYALGGTLYFLLTGVPPFRTGRPADDKYLKVVARHLRNPPPVAAVTNPAVDRELSDLALQMMAKSPADRPGYAEIVQRVSAMLARLDPGSIPEVVSARERSRPIVVPAPDDGGASLGGMSYRPSDAGLAPARRGLPAWLVMVTLVSLAVFAAGLVVFVQSSPGGKPAPGAGSGAGSGSAAAAGPVVPAGMLLIKHPDGSPWFLVDARPVGVAPFRQIFASHAQSGGADEPVVEVGYDEARSYAGTRGGRLLRGDEWDAAAATPGFLAVDALYEWVESPEGKRTVRRKADPGKSTVRTDKPQKDVTFRMAKDI